MATIAELAAKRKPPTTESIQAHMEAYREERAKQDLAVQKRIAKARRREPLRFTI